jgi:hypothetical protein
MLGAPEPADNIHRTLCEAWPIKYRNLPSAPPNQAGSYGDTLPIALLLPKPHDAGVARVGRIVAAGFPHHLTQRGNRRQTLYRDPLAERCRKAGVEVTRLLPDAQPPSLFGPSPTFIS